MNLSEINLPPTSDSIFFGKPYSEKKMILHASVRLSADRPSIFLMTGKLL